MRRRTYAFSRRIAQAALAKALRYGRRSLTNGSSRRHQRAEGSQAPRNSGCESGFARDHANSNLSPPAELNNPLSVALRRTPRRQHFPVSRCSPFGRSLQPHLFALFRLAIQLLRLRRRTPHVTHPQNFYLELATLDCDSQHVAYSYFARRFCGLPVRKHSSQIATFLRQGSSFEEPCRPQPRIHPHAVHVSYFPTDHGRPDARKRSPTPAPETNNPFDRNVLYQNGQPLTSSFRPFTN